MGLSAGSVTQGAPLGSQPPTIVPLVNQPATSSSLQIMQQQQLQHPHPGEINQAINYRASEDINDNEFAHQFHELTTSQSMQFYQTTATTNDSTNVGQHQQKTQNLYISTSASYYTCQMCGVHRQQCECANKKQQAATVNDESPYLVGANEHQSPSSSASSTKSSSSHSSNSSSSNSETIQHNNLYGNDEYQQQQVSQSHRSQPHSQQQQQQHEFNQLVQQQASSQIDHQPRISDDQYSNYNNYKSQDADVCARGWNDVLGSHQEYSTLGATLRLEPILDSANQQQQQTYGHQLAPSLHKPLSSDHQDFNNNQEQDYQTNVTDDSFDQSIEQRQQGNYVCRTNNQEQLYTSAPYFTNSTSDNYHNQYSNHRTCNMDDNNMQRSLPPFEAIDDIGRRNHLSNCDASNHVQYSSRSSNYDQYNQTDAHIQSYHHHQHQPPTNLKTLENSQYLSQVQNQHIDQHQAQWQEQPVSQDHLVSSQNCTLSNQQHTHTFIDSQQHESQYATEPPLVYGSLQQLTMNCDSYSNQVSTTTEGMAPDGAQPQASIKARALKGRRGRPRKKGLRSKNKVNGKLWEFIRDLLLSDRTNPSFIRWERREDGVFKFVQSDKVAKMWGERKQNPKMTYEKLSRAMRYYYKSKVLLPVFGRRLVYKFGPNATGWLPSPNDSVY